MEEKEKPYFEHKRRPRLPLEYYKGMERFFLLYALMKKRKDSPENGIMITCKTYYLVLPVNIESTYVFIVSCPSMFIYSSLENQKLMSNHLLDYLSN
jgi:hypothetical protein